MQNASAGAQQTNLLERHNIGVVLLSSARGQFDVGDKHQQLASPTGNLAVICGQRVSAKNGFWSGAPEQQPELKESTS